MASRLDDKLNRLSERARDLPSQAARDEFSRVLLGQSNVLIARAARLIARAKDRELCPVLVEAFDRLLTLPADFDKSCRAKSAILDALDDLGYDGTEPFLAGIAYRQMEPVWGGEVDTAADLRATCAIMLGQRYYPDIYFALVPLLVDPEPSPRVAAASVLGGLGSEASELLLMMKVLNPEQDPMVLRTCFAGLLSAGTDRSWKFVAGFLKSPHTLLVESAAMALGESHDENAFKVLREAWESSVGLETAGALALALALNRTDRALDYLIGVISGSNPGSPKRAIEAVSIYSGDERLKERVREAADSRQDRAVMEAYQRAFAE